MSRSVTLVCVLLLVGYCLVSSGQAEPEGAAIARKPRYSWRQTDSSLALLNHGRIVWQLNFNKKEGKPYFHPVGLTDGTVLTWLRPADHRWHRALWFSWKYINSLNYWEEDPKTGLSQGRTEIVFIKAIPQDDYSARIAMGLSYHPPDKPAVLTESRLITVSAPDENGRYRIRWRSTFTAGAEDVLLDRTPIPGEKGGKSWGGYAGLSVRMAKATRGWQFVNSEGRKDKEAHGKRARWVDFSGELADGKEAGIAIFDYPGNLRHPTPWYVAKGMPYFSPAVLFNKSYTLAAGKSLTLRYRILIHPGRADRDMLEGELKAFLKTSGIEVRIKSAEKLKQLALAALMYAYDHKGKFAADLNKLKPYLGKENLFEWIVENVEYIGEGKMTDVRRPHRRAVAYDRTLLGKGYGTNVAFMDGHVEFLRPEQLEKLGIKPGRKTNVEVEEKSNSFAQEQILGSTDKLVSKDLRIIPVIKPHITIEHKRRVDTVLFLPNGKALISESFGEGVKVSDTQSGNLLRSFPRGYAVNSMAMSHDGATLAIGTNRGTAEIWSIETLNLEKRFQVTEWSIYAVALSPDGKMLASCAADGTIQLWDIESSRLLYSLGKKGGRMISMSFSGDSKFIAALSRTGRISVWDVANGQLVGALHIKRISEIGSIAFCPDRSSVAIAAPDGIRFWNPQNDGQIRMIELPDSINPEKTINGLGPNSRPIYMGMTIVSCDCKTAATVIEDGSIVVWDIKTRAIQQKLAGLRIPDSAGGGIRAITFSPDKRLLASGNRNGTVEVYRLVEEIVVKGPYVQVED